MAVSYVKLWKLLLDKQMKRVDLKEVAGISSSTLAKFGKGDYVSMEIMDRVCTALEVDIGDVMGFTKNKQTETD